MESYAKRLEIKGNLTKADFERLYKSCKDARLKEKYHAMLLGFDYDWEEVAQVLYRTPKQIRKWVKKYNKHGLEGLKAEKQKGNPSKLSEEQKADLKKIVTNNPRDIGYNFSTWNAKNLKRVIEEKFGAIMSQESVRRNLTKLGFRWKKPEHMFVLSNKEEKEKFRQNVKEAIENKKDDEVILFEDECTARQHPTLKHTWILKGVRKFIGTFGNHTKKHAFAFVNILTGNSITRVTDSLEAEEFIAGLEDVKRSYKGKKVKLFTDKARIHKSKTSKKTREYLENNKGWLTVEYIPTQSPELNPVEQLWQEMRKIVTHNHLFSTIKELGEALLNFFSSLTKKEVLSICRGIYL